MKTARQLNGMHKPKFKVIMDEQIDPENDFQHRGSIAAAQRGDFEGVLKKLTPLQARFADEYIVDFNAKDAAIRAGSKSKDPRCIGYQMLQHPGVKLAIDMAIMARAERSPIKPDYVINKVVRTIERAEMADKPDHTAVLRGCELLARHLGMFIDRTEISGKDGEAIKYEKIEQDVNDFTSSIARLADRGRKNQEAGGSDS